MAQNRSNLGFLGEEFQYRLAHEFMINHSFFEDLSPIIDQNMFTDPSLKVFVGVMKNYYETEECVPDKGMMDTELRNISHSEKESETYIATLEKVMSMPDTGADRIKELAERFFRQQNIIRTANQILKIAGNGDVEKYDECVGLLNDAMTKGTHNDFGESLFNHLEETLSDDYRMPIPTGIDLIDETLEGGLGKGELGVIIGPTSFGKVQPFDSQIATPNGFKNMGDIKVGDYVIGRNGKPTKVIGVYPHKNWQFYKVTFSDGVSCECGKEHLWAVNSYYQRSGKKYVRGISKNKDDKRYAPDHSFKTLSLEDIVKKGLFKQGRHNFKVPMCQPVEFEKRNLSIDPYLMGYLIGDGNFSKATITVGKQDIDESSNLLSECNFKFVLHERKNRACSLTYGSELKAELSKYFDLSLTSGGKYIPKDYLYSSLDDRVAILNGLMDSDGTCMKNGRSCFNTKSRQLAEDVKTLVLSLGGFAKVREKSAKYFNKKYNELRDCGIHYEVTVRLCDSSIPIFRLKRKQDRVAYRTLRSGERFFERIEKSRVCDGQCIKVDAEDELYLTDSFIVTHNTSLTTAIASHAACNGFKALQIVFEDRIKQIQRKHIGRITGIEAKDLSKPENIDYVRETIENFPNKEALNNNLRIVRFPSGEKTARDIGRFIKKLRNSGFKPDLVVIDYFECLEHEGDRNSTNEFEKEGKTMRRLESMAGEFDVALWVPSQGTKDSLNLELVTMDKMGGSAKKAQIAHVIMSIARTVDDIANNKATIAILKNRAGKSGKVFDNVEFNNGTCRISTDDVTQLDSLFDAKKQRDENAKEKAFEAQNEILKKMRNSGTA